MKKQLLFALFLLVVAGSTFAQGSADPGSKRMRPALLVIDIQNEFLPMVQDKEKENALFMINAMIGLFRQEGFPVVRVYHSDPLRGPKEGTEGFNFPKTTMVLPEDPMVIKQHGSGFKETGLDKILKDRNVNTVFITGLSAVGCALATYIEAGDLGYNNFFVKNSLMSHNSEYTRQIEDIFAALNYDTVKIMLENAVKPATAE
ncbi:MAG: isochorismatase family protein [Bacteroidetes bacterium]|nr:isochorismatase family protein [Bacteroidota bacterium]